MWSDLAISEVNAAEVRFEFQVDRQGQRQPLKTAESRRTVELPRQLAPMLIAHRLRSEDTNPTAFVFATCTGLANQQRYVGLALRRAQGEATEAKGRPTYPILHQRDADGDRVPVPRGTLPSFHSFRHSAASEAIAAEDSAEEVSWQLGHKNSIITRAIYVQEIKSASAPRRRASMEARYGGILTATTPGSGDGDAGGGAGVRLDRRP